MLFLLLDGKDTDVDTAAAAAANADADATLGLLGDSLKRGEVVPEVPFLLRLLARSSSGLKEKDADMLDADVS